MACRRLYYWRCLFQTCSRPSSAAKKSERASSALRSRRPLQRQGTVVLPVVQEHTAFDNNCCIRTLCEHEEVLYHTAWYVVYVDLSLCHNLHYTAKHMHYFLTQEIKYIDKDNDDDVGRQQTGSEETHETVGLSLGSIEKTAVKPVWQQHWIRVISIPRYPLSSLYMAYHGHTADMRLHGYIQQHHVRGEGSIKARLDVLEPSRVQYAYWKEN